MSASTKSKYINYTVAFKLRVIQFAEQNSNRAAGRQFCVSEGHVRYWRKQKDALLSASSDKRALRGPKDGKYPDLEKELVKYVEESRNKCCAVTHKMLMNKALEIAKSLNISELDFKASRGWVTRFMKRNNFSLRRRTSLCQRLPRDYTDKLISFQRYVIDIRREKSYDLSQIGNADQTPVFFDMPRNSSVEKRGSSSVVIRTSGAEKQRCTVMLAVTADGAKLPPYVIFKRKTIPKGVQFPKGLHVAVQENGWMEKNLMIDWVKKVWQRRPGGLLRRPSLLVLDSFRGHLMQEVKDVLKEGKTDMALIPGGLTSVLQPLDVSINKPFKEHLKNTYANWMCEGEHTFTPTGKIKRPSIQLMCEWILQSWSMISADIVKKSFKKTCISNALDGTEDDECWLGDENEIDMDASTDSESGDTDNDIV